MNRHRSRQPGWVGRIRRWLGGTRTGETAFPDYLTCPYCGELEIEVWNCEEPVRCHACLREFTCTEAQLSHSREQSH